MRDLKISRVTKCWSAPASMFESQRNRNDGQLNESRMEATPDEELGRCFDRTTAFLAPLGRGSTGIQEFDALLRRRLNEKRAGTEKLDARRRELVNRYEKAIASKGVSKTKGPKDHLEVHLFGSAVMGLGSRESDLDISIEGTYKGGPLFKTKRVNKAKVLRNLMYTRGRLIRFVKDQKDIQFHPQARVPVVKFVDKATNLACDLTVGNTDGVFKSPLLGTILRADDRFVDLVVLVKLWASANDIKSGAEGKFTSFALTLLVVTFLQTKGLLPPLKEIIPGAQDIICHPDKSNEILRYLPKYQIRVNGWVAAWRKKNKVKKTVGQLLIEFLAFFTMFVVRSRVLDEFTREVAIACPWDGYFGVAVVKKSVSSPVLRIEDPFDPSANCGRAVTVKGLKQAVTALEGAILHIQALAEGGGGSSWASFNSMLFDSVDENGAGPMASLVWPELGSAPKQGCPTAIVEGLFIDGVRRRGQIKRDLGMGWLTPNLHRLFTNILKAEGVKYHQGLDRNFLLVDQAGPLGVAEVEVETMLGNSSEPDAVGDKFRELALEGRLPTQFRVQYFRETTLHALMSFAHAHGFECAITPQGRLRFERFKPGALADGIQANEELNEALLEDLFAYFLDGFSKLPDGQEALLDLERYVVAGRWVRRLAVRLSKKFVTVSVKQPDRSREVYHVKKLTPGEARQGRKKTDRIPVACLGGCRPRNSPFEFRHKGAISRPGWTGVLSRGRERRLLIGRPNVMNSHPYPRIRLMPNLVSGFVGSHAMWR